MKTEINNKSVCLYSYAKAVFELACKHDELLAWQDFLHKLSVLMQDIELQKFYVICYQNNAYTQTIANKLKINDNFSVGDVMDKHTSSPICQVMLNVLQNLLHKLNVSISSEMVNFLRLLIVKNRILAVIKIYDEFQKLHAEYNNILHVKVVSAFALSQDEQERLSNSLHKKYQHTIDLCLEVKPDLIGGLIIYIDDKVIDASVVGQLQRLSKLLR